MKTPLLFALFLLACEDLAPLRDYCPGGASCWVGPDGSVQLDVPEYLYRGDCHPGTVQCDGETATCIGVRGPVSERCDLVDNDCNGGIDDLSLWPGHSDNTCPQELGACQRAYQDCVGGTTICHYILGPQDEDCNGVDDDCDGEVDEGLGTPVYSYPSEQFPGTLGHSPCAPGISYCQDGREVETAAVLPREEVCGNEVDDDCDGTVDEPEGPSEPEAIVLVLDISGSMTGLGYFGDVRDTVCDLAVDPVLAGDELAVVTVADGVYEPYVALLQDFAPADVVCDTLNTPGLEWRGGGTEYMLEGVSVAGQLDWPEGFERLVIAFGDEDEQIFQVLHQDIVDDCAYFGYDLGVFTLPQHRWDWEDLTTSCSGFIEYLDQDLETALRARLSGSC